MVFVKQRQGKKSRGGLTSSRSTAAAESRQPRPECNQGCLQVSLPRWQGDSPAAELTLSKDPFHKPLHFGHSDLIYTDNAIIYSNTK